MPLAVISPWDNFAGLLSVDGSSVEVRQPSTSDAFALPIPAYLSRFPDSRFTAVEDWDGAFDAMSSAREQSATLEFSLMLFDSSLSNELRRSVAAELEVLIADAENATYALDVLLAVPLPSSADVHGARAAALDQRNVGRHVDLIVQSQERVRFAHRAWHSIQAHPMVRTADTGDLRGTFIRVGLFRRFVLDATTQADASSLIGGLVHTDELRNECDPRIVLAFASAYKEQLPPGDIESRTAPVHAAATARRSDARRTSTPNLWKAEDLAEWAANQVATIAEHFRTGKDQLGHQFAEELISSQSQDTDDHSHVVKSICNLAKQCADVGRRDLSLNYMLRVFEFETAIDATAYAQLGREFLRLKQLERAEHCYARAQGLETDGNRLEELTRKLIRVTVERGKYSDALAQYDRLDQLWSDPNVLTDRGLLLRRMGDLRQARDSYRRAIELDPNRHGAFAGLAEVRKQAGKIEKAIKSYDSLFERFQALDRQSERVYLLAESHLWRLRGTYSKSQRILTKLISQYPHDPDVNFQFGNLLILMGQREEGVARVERARKSRSANELSDELYSLAMRVGSQESQHASLEQYRPEERGLGACRLALDALMRDSCEEASDLIESAQHVEKLHKDFGWVLLCHVQKRLDHSFNYKTIQPMARIAKRGQHELRATVHAIACERFDEAFEHEKRMCLLLTS